MGYIVALQYGNGETVVKFWLGIRSGQKTDEEEEGEDLAVHDLVLKGISGKTIELLLRSRKKMSVPGGMAIGKRMMPPHTRYLVLGCKCSFSRGESWGGVLVEPWQEPRASDWVGVVEGGFDGPWQWGLKRVIVF